MKYSNINSNQPQRNSYRATIRLQLAYQLFYQSVTHSFCPRSLILLSPQAPRQAAKDQRSESCWLVTRLRCRFRQVPYPLRCRRLLHDHQHHQRRRQHQQHRRHPDGPHAEYGKGGWEDRQVDRRREREVSIDWSADGEVKGSFVFLVSFSSSCSSSVRVFPAGAPAGRQERQVPAGGAAQQDPGRHPQDQEET